MTKEDGKMALRMAQLTQRKRQGRGESFRWRGDRRGERSPGERLARKSSVVILEEREEEGEEREAKEEEEEEEEVGRR